MKKYGKDIVKLVLFLSLGVFFVWFSLKDLSAEQRSTILTNAKDVMHDNRWIYLIICMFIGFLSVVFRGLRSVLMIDPMGYKVSKTNSYHAAMIGYLANFVFPRLGEVLRCTVLQKYEKVPFQKSLGTVITERIIDVLFFGILLLLAVVLDFNNLLQSLIEIKNLPKQGDGSLWETVMSGTGKYIIIGLLVVAIVLVCILRKKILKWSVYQKIVKIIKGFRDGTISIKDFKKPFLSLWYSFRDGLLSIKKLKKPFLFVVYSLLIWVCYYLMFYICTFAFPFLTVLDAKMILLASLICVVIGTVGVSITQGGLGIFPLFVAIVLQQYEVVYENGISVGWVTWSTETLMYIVLGLISILVISLKKGKKTA